MFGITDVMVVGERCMFPDATWRSQTLFECAPTSVASERLFSSAAQVYTDRRSRLLPKHASMLLFLKHILKLENYVLGAVRTNKV